MDVVKTLSDEFKIRQEQVKNTLELLDLGNTVPFIARYRKEVTGGLDDQLLRELADRLDYLRNLDKRREEIKTSIDSTGNMTEEIQASLDNAQTLAELEDIYRPYKPKRKTRASIAKAKGLEPLADFIFAQGLGSPEIFAEDFISEELEVATVDDAIAGALDIIAENISDNAELRKDLVDFYYKTALISSKAVNDEAESVYHNYYDYDEGVSKIPSHRILAIDRGEREGFLKVSVNLDTERVLAIISKSFVIAKNDNAKLVTLAIEDSFSRLLHPSLERRIRSELTEKASSSAIKVFADNLRQLLLQPPVKGAVVLGLDPAYRTGCKIAVVDDTGKVLDKTVIYPTPPQKRIAEAKATLKALINKYKVTVISIGNGTASRESEIFVADLIKELDNPVAYMVVSEAGASVYSASKLAAEEFPDFDVSMRSAVSIARRLQDPLAELVKIDPKAIGVGQYQHDMPKKELSNALGGVVESCVNSVGVDLNTASHSLLSYIAGINATTAKNIVVYREENGAFSDRKQLLKVPKLGKKAFEQSAGFLRISQGKNPLDNTAVHPESYKNAEALIDLCGFTLSDLQQGLSSIKEKADSIGKKALAEKTGLGIPTLTDIIDELAKPGRDPRDELPPPLLRSDVMDMNSLKEGMELKGTVRNIVDFGAFVDIGVHEDGLVHISRMTDRYIKHPLEVVKVGDIINVKVLEVDTNKKRIALTMKGLN